MLILYVVFIITICSGISFSCKPSVDGETYVFRHIFKHEIEESLELVWLRNSIPISTCRRNMACYDYNAGKTVTTLKQLGDGLFETNHTIRNVTKADAGTMYLKYLGLASLIHSQPLFNCTLFVYAISVLTLQDCLDVVEEGTEVLCLCKKKDGISEPVKLYWLDHKGKLQDNGSPFLSFVAKRNDLGYTCRGWRSDGVESVPMGYRPYISSNNSEDNFINAQDSSFRLKEILIALCTVLLLMSLLIVMLYYFFTKECVYSKMTFQRFQSYKNLSKEKKCEDLLTHSVDYPETFVNVETKSCSLLNTESCNNMTLRWKKDNIFLYTKWSTKDFNVINDSDDSEGYASMGDDNS